LEKFSKDKSNSNVSRFVDPKAVRDLLDYRIFLTYQNCVGLTELVCRKQFGIGGRKWRILSNIAEIEGATVGEIAIRAELDLTQTSRAIGLLVREGFVKRLSNPENGRFSKVVLSSTGHDLYQAMFAKYREINNRLLAALQPEMLDQLDQILVLLNRQADVIRLSESGAFDEKEINE
jgi:DNA-binding MarR family transcriptional regulator